MTLVIGDLVREAQICAIPKRSNNGNFHLMRYIIEKVAKEHGRGGTLINLNRSKTFDSIHHLYASAVLNLAGFWPFFKDWIIAMHSDICSAARLNVHLSETFNIICSARQGCLLSSLFYVVILESLLHKLKALRVILRDLRCERCVSIYTDDVTVQLRLDRGRWTEEQLSYSVSGSARPPS